MVGSTGVEPATPSVSRTCSATELRANILNCLKILPNNTCVMLSDRDLSRLFSNTFDLRASKTESPTVSSLRAHALSEIKPSTYRTYISDA